MAGNVSAHGQRRIGATSMPRPAEARGERAGPLFDAYTMP